MRVYTEGFRRLGSRVPFRGPVRGVAIIRVQGSLCPRAFQFSKFSVPGLGFTVRLRS